MQFITSFHIVSMRLLVPFHPPRTAFESSFSNLQCSQWKHPKVTDMNFSFTCINCQTQHFSKCNILSVLLSFIIPSFLLPVLHFFHSSFILSSFCSLLTTFFPFFSTKFLSWYFYFRVLLLGILWVNFTVNPNNLNNFECRMYLVILWFWFVCFYLGKWFKYFQKMYWDTS